MYVSVNDVLLQSSPNLNQALLQIVDIIQSFKKGAYSSASELHLRATGRHLPYRITQFYLPPDTSERSALTQASKLVLDSPTPEGWKAELT